MLPNAVILVPLLTTTDNAIVDSTALAAGHTMYLRLTGPPQTRMVFARCIVFSDDTVHTEPSPGVLVRFPPPTHLLVGKGVLVEAIDKLEMSIIIADEEGVRKRLCIRPPELGGGLAKLTSDKGMSDIVQREKDLRLPLEQSRMSCC